MTNKNLLAAVEEKNKGNEAYKKRDFAAAHTHYDKAIELDPNNIVYLSNKASVFLEESKYEECIETCKKAVDVGRNNQADFKLIAKALARIGTAYTKLENLKEAIVWLDKSLSEFRDPEIVKKRQRMEKELKEKERLAYIDPEISEQEKTKGNELFKIGKYPDAMKHYHEAIKRNPDNALLYSNRAACYMKLMEFSLALNDCNTCIKLQPTFIKAYIRKGAALLAIKDYSKAKTAYEDALVIDPNHQEAKEGLMNCLRHTYGMMNGEGAGGGGGGDNAKETAQRAVQDPEIQAILADPAMRIVLEQMSEDPGALREHMKNPEIRKKILKLHSAGIVQMRSA